jgi:hypothetical protein
MVANRNQVQGPHRLQHQSYRSAHSGQASRYGVIFTIVKSSRLEYRGFAEAPAHEKSE